MITAREVVPVVIEHTMISHVVVEGIEALLNDVTLYVRHVQL